MRVYIGLRSPLGCGVYVWDTDRPRRPEPLDPARELWNHSADGFEWSYGDSGPAQLALALLYDCTDDVDFSIAMHHDVKRGLVEGLGRDIWARSELDVLDCAHRRARTVESVRQAVVHLDAARARCKKGGSGNVLII